MWVKGSIRGHGGLDRPRPATEGLAAPGSRCRALPGCSRDPHGAGVKEHALEQFPARCWRGVGITRRPGAAAGWIRVTRTCDARTRKVGSPNRAGRRRVGGRDPSRHGLCAGAGKPESTRKPRRSRLAAEARRSESYTERGQPRARGGPRLLYPPSGWGPPGHSIPVGAGPRPVGQAGTRVRRWGPPGRGLGLTAAKTRAAFSAREKWDQRDMARSGPVTAHGSGPKDI